MPIARRPGATVRLLVKRWLDGDRAAGQELCRLYYAHVWRFGLRLTGREHDADDIAQHALAEGLDGLRGGKRPRRLTAWFLGIAQHAANAHWRRGRHPSAISLELAESARGADPELPHLLARAMRILDADERAMIRMRFVERRSRAGAAARAGVSAGRAERLLVRALTKLRQVLEGPSGVEISLARIERLRPALRQVVEARHLRGLTLAQTAVALRLPVETCVLRLRCAYGELACTEDDDFSAARAAYLHAL